MPPPSERCESLTEQFPWAEKKIKNKKATKRLMKQEVSYFIKCLSEKKIH